MKAKLKDRSNRKKWSESRSSGGTGKSYPVIGLGSEDGREKEREKEEERESEEDGHGGWISNCEMKAEPKQRREKRNTTRTCPWSIQTLSLFLFVPLIIHNIYLPLY